MDPLLKELTQTLDEVSNNANTPQNIKKEAEQVTTLLIDKNESIEARKNKATQILEDMAIDLNIDMEIRTTLYRAISLVESLNNNNHNTEK